MTVTSAPPTESLAPLQRETGARWSRFGLVILVIGLVLGVTYGLAWWDAYRLSASYMADADASFAAGNYLDALRGYETFDAQTNRFVQHGGYTHVEHIWRHPWAWPRPSQLAIAAARIDEIIDKRLTTATAEQFVQENTGRPSAYMGRIFLRLGELYEAEGDARSAKDIYAEIPDLFPNEPALIQQAQAHLQRLESQ